MSRDKIKAWWYFEYSRGAGQRIASGVFSYVKPNAMLERNHNKFITGKLQTEQAQRVRDLSEGIAPHLSGSKLQTNLLDFYTEWVAENKTAHSRHVEGSLRVFKLFLQENFAPLKGKPEDQLFLSPDSVTEELCEKFRNWLVKKFIGDTPANYFSRFKRRRKNATKLGYFRVNPCEDVASKKGKRMSGRMYSPWKNFSCYVNSRVTTPKLKKRFCFLF